MAGRPMLVSDGFVYLFLPLYTTLPPINRVFPKGISQSLGSVHSTLEEFGKNSVREITCL